MDSAAGIVMTGRGNVKFYKRNNISKMFCTFRSHEINITDDGYLVMRKSWKHDWITINLKQEVTACKTTSCFVGTKRDGMCAILVVTQISLKTLTRPLKIEVTGRRALQFALHTNKFCKKEVQVPANNAKIYEDGDK